MSGDIAGEEGSEVTPHGGPLRRLVMKHPFWVATIFGLLFFPTLKLFSVRHIPPSPVLGKVTQADLTRTDGPAISLPLNAERPWYVAMLNAADMRTTPAVLSALRDLRSQIDRERLSFPIVILLAPGASPDSIATVHRALGQNSDLTYVLTGEPSVLLKLRESLSPALGDHTGELRSVARIGLIDASGMIRAGAPIGALGLSELVQHGVALGQHREQP